MARKASALDLSFHAHLRVVAERRRKFLLGPDTQAHPPREFPLDRRPTGGHQALPRRTQPRTKALRLESVSSVDLGKARQTACIVGMSQSTSDRPTRARSVRAVRAPRVGFPPP